MFPNRIVSRCHPGFVEHKAGSFQLNSQGPWGLGDGRSVLASAVSAPNARAACPLRL